MAPRASSTSNHSGLVAGAHARNDPTVDLYGLAAGDAYHEKTPSVQSAKDDRKNSTSRSRLTKNREIEDFAHKQISDYNDRQNQYHPHRNHNHSTNRNNVHGAQPSKKVTQDNLFDTTLPPLSPEARDQRSRRLGAVLGPNRRRHNSAVRDEGDLDIFMHHLTLGEADPETNTMVADAGGGWRERLTGAGVGIPGFR